MTEDCRADIAVIHADEEGRPQLVVSHDPSDPVKAGMIRMDCLGATIWIGPKRARRLALALLRLADARTAAARSASTFAETDTVH